MSLWLIIGFISSFTLLVFLLIFLFGTGVGTEGLRRWKNKKLFMSGGYTSALIFTKDGLLKEVFGKNIDGKFRFDDSPYVRTPSLSFPFKGLPTYLYREGKPNPLDVNGIDPEMKLSCKELDMVMNQSNNFDFKEWFDQNKLYILIGFGLVVLLLALNLFFAYNGYEWFRDVAPTLVKNVGSVAQASLA